MVLEAIGGCSPKGRQLGNAGGKFLLNQPKENCRNEKNRTKEMWKRHPTKTFFGEAIGGWSPKGRQPGQAGEPGWEGAILLPRPD